MTIEHLCNHCITPMDRHKAERVIQEVKHKLKLAYWVGAGTALGLYRQNDFIPNDTDLDFEIIYFKGIENALTAQLGYKLFRRVTHEGLPHQLCFIANGVLVDFYIYHQEGEKWVNYYEHGKLEFPIQMFEGCKYINTRFGSLPFLANTEAYLEYRYGDWRTPSENKGIYNQSK
jgi:hypothetical protein